MKAIWHGGFIYTMLEEGDLTEAVYIEDGVIKGTGSYERLKKQYGAPETEEISLNGAVMFPGFVDSHLHLIGHGEKQLQLDLSALTSKEAILQAAKEESDSFLKAIGSLERAGMKISLSHRTIWLSMILIAYFQTGPSCSSEYAGMR